MELFEVNQDTYDQVINQPFYVFGSGSFAELSSHKVDRVYYLLFKDTKFRLGITVGIKEKQVLSPFSAPFGGFVFIKEDIKIKQIEGAVNAFQCWASNLGFQSIKICLPPHIYCNSFVSKCFNVLFRSGFDVEKVDLSYYFPATLFANYYENRLKSRARNKLKIGIKNNLVFKISNNRFDDKSTYEIIKQNREEKGFPLRLTWEAIKQTTEIIPADFFLCKTKDNVNIASAIAFHIAKGVVQVIYWGDLNEYTHLKTMNFLAFKLFEHYSQLGIKIIDLGPSTENSEPNHGLCEFKESIGAMITPKISLIKEI